MTKKQSESQDKLAKFFESIAEHVEGNRGLFDGVPELTAAEVEVAVRQARGIAKDFREKASRNRSIGN